MYKITTHENHLLVTIKEDFSYNAIKAILHHEAGLPEYAGMNDIWLVGQHHALISLGDLETVVADFVRMCPANATRQKTAIVVDPGLTESIMRIWARGVDRQLQFECRVFHTMDEAEAWLGVAESKVA